ncbi:glycine cleavage system protein GcvH [Thermodesulfobacteriota bacterium]
MHFPEGLKYSEEHTWVSVEGNIATVGITEYASDELNNVLVVELPQEGDMVDQGESFGSLESSKTVSDVFAPVSGEVIDVNSDAIDDPGIVNEYPYDDGWLIKVRMNEPDELVALLSHLKYETYVDEEADEDSTVNDDFDDIDDDE